MCIPVMLRLNSCSNTAKRMALSINLIGDTGEIGTSQNVLPTRATATFRREPTPVKAPSANPLK